MLSGVPVIATKVGVLSDFATDNYDILFAEAGNIEEIASKLLWVEHHKTDAMMIARNAIITARCKFSADSYVPNFIEYLNQKMTE